MKNGVLGQQELTPDWYTAIQLGTVAGHSILHREGHIHNAGTTIEDIWVTGGVKVWLQAASAMEIISNNAADTLLGAGARTVFVEGLSGTFAPQSEIVSMNGLGVTALANTYTRINNLSVVDCGTYGGSNVGGNLGRIDVQIAAGGAIQSTIDNDAGTPLPFGRSHDSHFTVPLGFSAWVIHTEIIVDSGKTAEIFYYKREGADIVVAPFTSPKVTTIEDGISGVNGHKPVSPEKMMPEKTDFWLAAISGQASTAITANYEILLIDNNYLGL